MSATQWCLKAPATWPNPTILSTIKGSLSGPILQIFIGPESDHWECLSVTHWLPFSKLDWCDSGMWRWQLKTCWSCYCCWGWWWETCRQQFGAVRRWTLGIKLSFCLDFEDKVSRFVQDFEVDLLFVPDVIWGIYLFSCLLFSLCIVGHCCYCLELNWQCTDCKSIVEPYW